MEPEELDSAVITESVETPDDFFRDKGPAAPGLVAFSLLDSALLPFRSVSPMDYAEGGASTEGSIAKQCAQASGPRR